MEPNPAARFQRRFGSLCRNRNYGAANDYVRRSAGLLVRTGATADLVGAIERLPPDRREPETLSVHARARARLFELAPAFDELRVLIECGRVADAGSTIALGQMASMQGDLRLANHLFESVLARSDLDERDDTWARCARALNLTHLGRGEEGRDTLADSDVTTRLGIVRSVWLLLTHWVDESSHLISQRIDEVTSRLPGLANGYRISWHVPAAMAGILARAGRFEDADRYLAAAERSTSHHQDLVSTTSALAMRACIAYEQGDRLSAAPLLTVASLRFEAMGNILGQVWCDVYRARLALLGGRRGHGLAALDTTARLAGRHGIVSALDAIERSYELDPLFGARPRESRARTATRLRAAAWQAVRASLAGRTTDARQRASDVRRAVSAPAHAFECCLVDLAETLAALVDGDDERAGELLEVARGNARRGGVEDALIDEIFSSLARYRIIGREHRRVGADDSPADVAAANLVLDARSHELRAPGRILSLRRRDIGRRILYALARQPGRELDREHLVPSVWGREYDPRRHDNTLWVNVRNLRTLLGETGLKIVTTRKGYRLDGPSDFLFIEPICL